MKSGFLSQTKECTTCANCGGDVTIPPGVYYEGQPHHLHCARRLERLEFASDVIDPIYDRVEEEIEEALDT